MEPIGKSGGICIAWKDGVDIEISLINANMINTLVFSDPPDHPWMLTLVYWPPGWFGRNKYWEDLELVANSFVGPSACLGDFNQILSQADKVGGRPLAASSSRGFSRFFQGNDLVDLGFSGNSFTWSNRRGGTANIRERIDRGIANLEWRSMFPRASIVHLPAIASNHCPVILNTVGEEPSLKKPFKFEAMCTRDQSSTCWKLNGKLGPILL